MTELIEDMEALRDALEEFVLDRNALPSIEKSFVGFNVFEAIGHTHAEERHSNFLGFLLDPRESHGLGDRFLREFILRTVKSVPRDERTVDLVEISLSDLSSTLILREHRNIDIFAINDEEKFVVVIENKIRSKEHSNQLQRYRQYVESQYPDHNKIYVYLTPDGEEPSDSSYIPYTYSEIVLLIEDVAKETQNSIPTLVFSALEQYLQILRRHIVPDNDLVKLAESIYQKHKRALDFIYEQRSDLQLELNKFIVNLITKSGFVLDKVVKTSIHFAPKEWANIPQLNKTGLDEWTKTDGRSVLFEIRNTTTLVSICLVVGPTIDEKDRQKIFDYCSMDTNVFKNCSAQLYPKTTTLYSQKIINRQQLEDSSTSELEPKIKEAWEDFLEGDLRRICDAFQGRFAD